MNKQEFLSKLSKEELDLLRDMEPGEINREFHKRNTKPIEIKVGDCFICRNNYEGIYLTKIINYIPGNSKFCEYFECEEISIGGQNISIYEITYYLDGIEGHDRIDSEIFDKIAALVNTRDNAIDKVCEEFDKQIRELCSTLLNTQNKN